MWAYVFRRLLYNVPVFLGIILFVMAALRVNDPIYGFLGKNATQERYDNFKSEFGLDDPFVIQYVKFLGRVVTLDFSEESWDNPGLSVGRRLRTAIVPSLALTLPALLLTSIIATCVGIVSAYFRGRLLDRLLVIGAVLGMSISFLVYIILGQYFGAYRLNQHLPGELFAIDGYEPGMANWVHYCLLPVLISVIVAMGYDTRFYRAVMVEESARDYIMTAQAKGASQQKIMFVHMLKNAMIPIVTRVMTTLPFLITGSILLETYFSIPGISRAIERRKRKLFQAGRVTSPEALQAPAASTHQPIRQGIAPEVDTVVGIGRMALTERFGRSSKGAVCVGAIIARRSAHAGWTK